MENHLIITLQLQQSTVLPPNCLKMKQKFKFILVSERITISDASEEIHLDFIFIHTLKSEVRMVAVAQKLQSASSYLEVQ